MTKRVAQRAKPHARTDHEWESLVGKAFSGDYKGKRLTAGELQPMLDLLDMFGERTATDC